MKFTWLGGAGWLLELGAFRIAGDPVLADRPGEVGDGAIERTSPPVALDPIDTDVLCLTCVRADHFDPGGASRVFSGASVFVPADGAEAVSAAGFTDVRSPGAFDALSLEKTGESLVVTVVPATSPSGADYGFFLRHDAGGRTTTVYCTGDAVFSDEIRRIQRELGHANLLIQHLGGEQTADGALASPDAREAMQFVYRMQPNAVAAVHHTTWSHYRQPLEPFVEQIGRTIYERRLRVLSEGQSFEK